MRLKKENIFIPLKLTEVKRSIVAKLSVDNMKIFLFLALFILKINSYIYMCVRVCAYQPLCVGKM